ncbi:hypothetical protein [Parvularcula dongshanensis]|uniref:Uncharacterized protein n=1 Tax=Parvularcula dongshanensis TaxID=1173995 RepID=A0A840I461_9PROT|nr:hypothetical protein [Parvularcula dongshanensis]MBB4659053.1 hypothetical protein [Parvularcula dongshanensis]
MGGKTKRSYALTGVWGSALAIGVMLIQIGAPDFVSGVVFGLSIGAGIMMVALRS